MSPAADGPGRRARWWSPLLLVHAALVVVLVLVQQLGLALPGSSTGPVESFATALAVVLTAPWLLVFLGAPAWVLLVGNLALHLGLLRAFGAREAAGLTERPVERPASRSAQFALSVAAGVLVWGAWLGWDTSASFDVVTREVESPHVTLQVLGCALTTGAVTAVLGARWWWAAAAGGVSVGFWLGWTTQAGAGDDTGLYLVGALVLAVGLGAGTSFAAFVGRVLSAAHRERASD
ncbi:hypothetical protein FHN55_13435 [Streptomyces sp. NP160]|uniref:hypothetical protein n=1 Tax=Streptomyces sp. NP160 TaxID=2586637 RepID=UPI001117BCFB|nr:hypothetical protein [Streptomyces sp. NP160]TNM64525.1 hypothetical protein FHN55_13435 [Streptomyces sp. NP160]